MGIYDREYYREDEPRGFNFGGRTMVMNIIIVNVAIFIVDAFISSDAGSGNLGRLMGILALRPSDVVEPWNWWRLLTNGFAHDGPGHIFSNMLGLFFFGRFVEQVYGKQKFLAMYITAILLGSLLWAIGYFSAGRVNYSLVGASGAVTAVVLLFCIHFPKQTVLFMLVIPMPAWVLGVILIGSDILGTFQGGSVAHNVHLIGAAYGYLFYRTRFALDDVVSPTWFRGIRKHWLGPKLRVHRPEDKGSTDDPIDSQADAILEKLHRHGESSLSAKERRILEKYSRKMQQKRR